MWPIHFKHSHWWKRRRLRDQRSMWMHNGCKVYVNSCVASNGSCFMVTWIVFKNHLLDIGLITNLRDHDTPKTHNRWFIIFYHAWEDPYEQKFIEIAFGWGPGRIWLHTTLEGPWPHDMILEVCWDSLWTLSFGLSQFHGHGSWLVCEVARSIEQDK